MSYNHPGKLTIAPDFDWITGDNIGFDVVANLLKLFLWMEWMKIMKHWYKNTFFGSSLLPKSLPISLPLPSHPSIPPSLPLSLPLSLSSFLLCQSHCTISLIDWLLLVKVYPNLIQVIVIGTVLLQRDGKVMLSPLNKAVAQRDT